MTKAKNRKTQFKAPPTISANDHFNEVFKIKQKSTDFFNKSFVFYILTNLLPLSSVYFSLTPPESDVILGSINTPVISCYYGKSFNNHTITHISSEEYFPLCFHLTFA